MPWKNVLPMEEKQRFVNLMESGHFTVSELCEEYGVSRKTEHTRCARCQSCFIVFLVSRLSQRRGRGNGNGGFAQG